MRRDLVPASRAQSATMIGLDPDRGPRTPPATRPPIAGATAPSAGRSIPAPPPRRSRRAAVLASCTTAALMALPLAGHLRAKDGDPVDRDAGDRVTAREQAALRAAASLVAFAPPADAAPIRAGEPRRDAGALPPPFDSIPVPRRAPAPRAAAAATSRAPAVPPPAIPDLIEGEAPAWPIVDPLAAMAVDGSLRRVDPALSPFALNRIDPVAARPRAELALRDTAAAPLGWYEGGESLPGGWTVLRVDAGGAVDLMTPRGNLLRLVR